MPLLHRSSYYSLQGESFFEATGSAFYQWLNQSRETLDTEKIGKNGKYEEIGPNTRAREDHVEDSQGKYARYSQIVINEQGTYSSQLTVANKGYETWAQLDVHAPRENSKFSSPRLARTLIKEADTRKLCVSAGSLANRLTQAPQVKRVEQVGDLIDDVLESSDRLTAAIVIGTSNKVNYRQTLELMENFTEKSVGVASIWALDPYATREFNSLVPVEYHVFPSSIRTFQSRLDFKDRGDARRHSYLPFKELFGDESKPRPSIQNKLYHLCRTSPLREPLPDELLEADRILTEYVHKSRLKEVEHQPLRDRMRGIQVDPAPSKKVPESPRPHPDNQEPAEKTAKQSRTSAIEKSVTESFEGTDLAPATQNVGLPDKLHLRTTEPSFPLVSTLRGVAAMLEIENAQTMDPEAIVFEIGDRADSAMAQLREAQNYANELQHDKENLARDKDILDRDITQLYEEISSFEKSEIEYSDQVSYMADQLVKLKAPKSSYQKQPSQEPASIKEIISRLAANPTGKVKFTGDEKAAYSLDDRVDSSTVTKVTWRIVRTLEGFGNLPVSKRGRFEDWLTNGPNALPLSKYSPRETSSLMNTEQFAGQRYLPVPPSVSKNCRIHMESHFKLSKNGGKQPRLHFYDALDIDGNIYIGYIGEHLDSRRTN